MADITVEIKRIEELSDLINTGNITPNQLISALIDVKADIEFEWYNLEEEKEKLLVKICELEDEIVNLKYSM